ncbi:DNA topoisomerase IB [Leptolyngbya sp. FACHB-321]|uniref:DNA topoisomerase IB n=1 Tax=Leptolyngbya sp. FACHB-321 TaxID=2692807 RepID=UPI001689605D|nr:DNA topoisomerase IB [Leptolyngbya sp. FACHB-321]MBD2037283.1 DNA topoisomerase IB [Leptolyngbya sp. FACHB-321]
MRLKAQKRSIQKHVKAVVTSDPIASAEAIGLRYVTDDIPGIQRKRSGKKGFAYIDTNGERIRDPDEIRRIDALAIPPAYKDVWICPFANGHLQATGRDAKGRKQYRYHPLWRSIRDQSKFTRMLVFSQSLPQIRQRLEHDLSLPGLPKEKVLAAILRLMELTRVRVGNEEYARSNQSYGLTTLRDEHVDIKGSKIQFHFRGKSGVEHEIELADKRLAKIVKRCQDIPGQELFQYRDATGEYQAIDSGDVNAYLRAITEQDFTAKDFRTWAGTVLAAAELADIGTFTSETGAKKNIVQAIKTVASYLRNRPATCRKYYIHPAILDAYKDESLHQIMEEHAATIVEQSHALKPEELAVVAMLEQQLMQELQQKVVA